MVNASLSYFCFIDVKLNSNLGRSLSFEERKRSLFVCLLKAIRVFTQRLACVREHADSFQQTYEQTPFAFLKPQ